MFEYNISLKTFIIPIVGAIIFYILNLPSVIKSFSEAIPNYKINLLTRTLLFLTILFLLCQIMIFMNC